MALWKLQLAGASPDGATLSGTALNGAALSGVTSEVVPLDGKTRFRRQKVGRVEAGDEPEVREVRIVTTDDESSGAGHGLLLYGGVLLGVLAGAAISTYLWWQREHHTPLDQADELISNCETKLNEIERAMEEWKAAR